MNKWVHSNIGIKIKACIVWYDDKEGKGILEKFSRGVDNWMEVGGDEELQDRPWVTDSCTWDKFLPLN